jgi:hypothetical protein
MALAFQPSLVDQHTGIRIETGKSSTEMVIEHDDLFDCTGFLEFGHVLLLDS